MKRSPHIYTRTPPFSPYNALARSFPARRREATRATAPNPHVLVVPGRHYPLRADEAGGDTGQVRAQNLGREDDRAGGYRARQHDRAVEHAPHDRNEREMADRSGAAAATGPDADDTIAKIGRAACRERVLP